METKNYYKNQLTKTLLYAAISATIFVSVRARQKQPIWAQLKSPI